MRILRYESLIAENSHRLHHRLAIVVSWPLFLVFGAVGRQDGSHFSSASVRPWRLENRRPRVAVSTSLPFVAATSPTPAARRGPNKSSVLGSPEPLVLVICPISSLGPLRYLIYLLLYTFRYIRFFALRLCLNSIGGIGTFVVAARSKSRTSPVMMKHQAS